MGRYDVLIKCAQIRKLIEENKYTKALEEIEGLDLSKVHSMSDLVLFANVFEKADRFTEARDIYYMIYEKKRSKRILYQLVLLVLRTGDLKEAKELYMEYEMAAGITLDTYELRYRLARASGESRANLIQLLEDLRAEEFTEEWGYQLAKLYELEGDRKKCIEICNEIVLWFGSGIIVEKAKELRDEVSEPDWQPPKDETIPEPIAPDTEEVVSLPYEEPANEDEPKQEKEKPVEVKPAEPKDTMPEENILISPHNIFYFTLKDILSQIHSHEKGVVHFAIAGGEERIALAIAKKLIKALNSIDYFTADSIAKIQGGKLNSVDIEEKIQKLVGGCMLILNAQEMETETVHKIETVMEKYKNDIVFVFTGEYDELDCWFSHYPELEQQVCYKVKL